MAFPEQEVPLILIFFLGSLGSAFILCFRNFLCPKESTLSIQKAYAGLSLLAIFLGMVSLSNGAKKYFLLSWGLSGILLLYAFVSFFLPSGYSRPMITWSDVFLVGLSVAFFFMRFYASLLLRYDRARQKVGPKSLIRPIAKPADFYTLSYPNSVQIQGKIFGQPEII